MKCCIRLKNWGFLWDVRHVLLHSAVTFFNRRHPKHGIKENFCSNKVLNIISFNVLLTGQKLRAMPITYGTKPSAFHMVTFPKFSGSTLHGSNTKGSIHLSSCLQFGLSPPDEHKSSPVLWFAISLRKYPEFSNEIVKLLRHGDPELDYSQMTKFPILLFLHFKIQNF